MGHGCKIPTAVRALVVTVSSANAATCENVAEYSRTLTLVQETRVVQMAYDSEVPNGSDSSQFRDLDAQHFEKASLETRPESHATTKANSKTSTMPEKPNVETPPEHIATTKTNAKKSVTPEGLGRWTSLFSKVSQQVGARAAFVPAGVMILFLLPIITCMAYIAFDEMKAVEDDTPVQVPQRRRSRTLASLVSLPGTSRQAVPDNPRSPLKPNLKSEEESKHPSSSPVPGAVDDEKVAWNGEPMSRQLCPELVVPPEGECTLFVPKFTLSAMDKLGSKITVDVTHARSSPMFRASIEHAEESCRIVLASALGDSVFAYCSLLPQASRASNIGARGASKENETPMCLSFYDFSNQHFGDMIRAAAPCNGSSYIFAMKRGWSLDFHIQSEDSSRRAFDDKGRLVASVERSPSPGNALRQGLTIGPCVDAGLILLIVLGMNLLEEVDRLRTTS